MPRIIRNTAILAKVETTYKTDAVPTGAANAMLVANMSINPLNANNVPRDLVRGYYGGSEQLVGTANVEVSFDVELAGAGAAGTAPAWGPLLQACAYAETISAGNRVEYNPVSTAIKSATIYYYLDGTLHKLLGARGTFQLKADIDTGRPVLSFRFVGIDGGTTAASNPSMTLSAWKTPVAITDANTVDITLGCTYATGALSGGTAFTSKGLTLDAGNQVVHTPLLGAESVDITQREITGQYALDLTAAQMVTLMTDIKANTPTSLGYQVGMTAGNIVLLYAPNVQRINPRVEDRNGIALVAQDLRLLPSSAGTGNDELIICVK